VVDTLPLVATCGYYLSLVFLVLGFRDGAWLCDGLRSRRIMGRGGVRRATVLKPAVSVAELLFRTRPRCQGAKNSKRPGSDYPPAKKRGRKH
jgi:hypothetical protein